MLLVTAISVLTKPILLTVLLEYTNHFNFNHNGNIMKELAILGLTLPYT